MTLPHNIVEIWRVPLAATPAHVQHCKDSLPGHERARAERFVFPHLHDAYVLAHAGLRRILAGYLPGCDPTSLVFEEGAHGKPSLRPPAGVRFNLSHSGTLALVAVSLDRILGVDIEIVREQVELDAVADTVFSRAEQRALATAAPEDRIATFFGTWVCKEAYIKAHGMGLAMPLHEFDIDARCGRTPRLLATRPDAEQASRWWLLPVAVPRGYYGALVVARRPQDTRAPQIRARTLADR